MPNYEDLPPSPELSTLIATAKRNGVELCVVEYEETISLDWIHNQGRSGAGRAAIVSLIAYAKLLDKPVILDAYEGRPFLKRLYAGLGFKPWTAPEHAFGNEWLYGMRLEHAAPQVDLVSPLAAPDVPTSAFLEWFGASQVVDANAHPLVVFHATRRSFTEFKEQSRGREFGFHFGSAGAAADRLRDIAPTGIGAQVLPVYLRIRNPVFLDCDPGNFTVYRLLTSTQRLVEPDAETGATIRLCPGPLERAGALSETEVERLRKLLDDPEDYCERMPRTALREMLEAKGFDGLVYPNTYEGPGSFSYVVFRSSQIKSALTNSGAYCPENPDITDRVAPITRKAAPARTAAKAKAYLDVAVPAPKLAKP